MSLEAFLHVACPAVLSAVKEECSNFRRDRETRPAERIAFSYQSIFEPRTSYKLLARHACLAQRNRGGCAKAEPRIFRMRYVHQL